MFDLFGEMRSQARKKAINVRDLFTECDIHYEGKISKLRFRRAFDNLDVRLDDPTFKELASIYTGDGGKVDYLRFLSDFENAATTKKVLTNEQLREFAKPLLDLNRTVSEVLRDSDRFHNGRVPYDNFVLAFGASPLTKEVADCYNTMPFNEVTYVELEHDIERALTEGLARPDPLSKAPAFFMDVVKTMRIKGVDPYLVLSAHDKFKKRTILNAHFKSDMVSMGMNLTPEQLQELSDAYSEHGRFNYVDFCEAVREAQGQENVYTMTKGREMTLEKQRENTVDVVETLKEVEKEVVDRRSQIGRAFEQFDLEGEGKLPPSAFRATLEKNHFRSLGTHELDAVTEEFTDADNMVNYKAFVMAVTPPPKSTKKETEAVVERLRQYLATKGLRLKPMMLRLDSDRKGTIGWTQLLAVLRNVQFDLTLRERRLLRAKTTYVVNIEEFSALVDPPPVQEPEEPSEEEEEEIEAPPREVLEALARVASVAQRDDVDLMDEFRRYELAPTGFIRQSTFAAVMRAVCPLMCETDINVLLEHYRDPKKRRVDGYKFVRDVRTYGNDQLILTPSLTLTSVVAEERTIDATTRQLMKRLKAHLASKQLNGLELFRVYDTQKTGYISKRRLNQVLSYIEFDATREEKRKLSEAFAAQKMPEQINYKKLVVAVDSENVTDSDLAAAPVRRSMTNSGEWELISVLNLMHNKLRDRRKTAEMAFVGLSNDPIPVDEFKARVASFGILIPTADLQTVIKKYRTNLRGDIDWRGFCDDVDSIKTVQPPR